MDDILIVAIDKNTYRLATEGLAEGLQGPGYWGLSKKAQLCTQKDRYLGFNL